MRQAAQTVLVIAPRGIAFNPETSGSNVFQRPVRDLSAARAEHDAMVENLIGAGVDVVVADPSRYGPDSHFPNNWFSTHEPGTVVLYPLLSPVRRAERDPAVIDLLEKRFVIEKWVDLSQNESKGDFLEGTGSIVFDRQESQAFAAISPRTCQRLFIETCTYLEVDAVPFLSTDGSGTPYYHTNVMLAVGPSIAVACPDSLEPGDREKLMTALQGKDLLEVSRPQVASYCCNLLELTGRNGQPVIALSGTAWRAFDTAQQRRLESMGSLVVCDVPTIEAVGGGSVRCMLAEIFLQPRVASAPDADPQVDR